jgi:hypothetical protein
MPKNVTVEEVDIQTKKAQKNLSDLSKEMDEVSESSKDMNDELTESNEQLEETSDQAGEASTKFGEMPGPVGKAGGAVKGLSATFKALLANPVVLVITLIVGALTALVGAFTSTKEGGEKVKQIMAGLSAAMDVLRDIAVTLGKRLVGVFKDPQQAVKNLWSNIKQNLIDRFQGLIDSARAVGKILKAAFALDFDTVKEGAKEFGAAMVQVATGFTPEEIVDGLKKVGNEIRNITREIVDEARAAASLTAQLQKVIDAQRDLSVLRAEQNRDLANQKRAIEDITLTYDERLKAIDQVLGSEQALLDQELALQRERLRIAEDLAALSDSDAETLDELAQLRITLAGLEEQSAAKRLETENKRRGLIKERAALEAQFDKASEDRHIAMIQQELERELAKLEQQKEIDLLTIEQSLLTEDEKQRQIAEIREFYAFQAAEKTKEIAAKEKDQAEKDAKEKADIEKALAETKVGYAESATAAVTQLAKEGTAAYKGSAAAQALIDTYKAAQAAYASLAGIPVVGPFLGIAAAAAAVVAGLRNVRNILRTDPSGGGAGQPAVPTSTGGFSGAIAETDLTTPNVRTITDPNAPPPKAYVVSQEMSNQQELDARIESQAGL